VPTILRDLPYFDRRTTVVVRGQDEEVKPTQIIVWASITDVGREDFDPAAPRFPVILDTGLSHNFSIKEELLGRWGGLDRRSLRKLRDITIGGSAVPLHEAEVWLHRNHPGERDTIAERAPFPLQLESGIAVYPRGMPAAPRLPLLGLRGLQWSKLHLSIDCERRRVSLRTRGLPRFPGLRWPRYNTVQRRMMMAFLNSLWG
jgi:hypothetical protein